MRTIMPTIVDANPEITLITRGVLRLSRRLRIATQSSALTGGALSLLATLYRIGPMSAAALAREEGLQPQSLSRLIAQLEAVGFIARVSDPGDRRNKIISITDHGHQSLHDAMQDRRRWLAAAIAERLSDEERQTLGQAAELMLRLSL